jgi:dynein heavy chain 1
LIEFLSLPSQRLQWFEHRLPQDDLCTENAIILQRYHRYPLVIDPAGQALRFIESLYAERKLKAT